MKIIQKSLEIALALFPETYKMRKKGAGHNYHFTFAWYKGKKLVAIGQNQPAKPSKKALNFARRYKTHHQLKYSYLHSEIHAISKLFGRIWIDSDLTIINIRLNRWFQLQNAKPCKSCSKILSALKIKNVIYSTPKGFKSG